MRFTVRRYVLKYCIVFTFSTALLRFVIYTNLENRKTSRQPLIQEGTISTNSSAAVMCPVVSQPTSYIDTIKTFPNLEFNVILVPHSHNDPGWLETPQYYLHFKSARILDNVIDCLRINKSYKFIWPEVALLQGWWKMANSERRKTLRSLVNEGQFEIVTGGWVMPDEAITTLYGLIDQYIEGHQWLNRHLNFKPTYGWSIDSFGHSSTVAHLLSLSGIKATVIQRIHYAWKQWFAYNRFGDFLWLPNVQTNPNDVLLTHNQPFHLYDTISSCGPTGKVCPAFTYGFYESHDLADNLDTLLTEYSKTGSFYGHNVILVPIGGDFSYGDMEELRGTFDIYTSVINAAKLRYPSINISFGGVKDFFESVLERQKHFPTLSGDFFVYADPFSFQASYWSGFYSTRPFLKILGRILEAQLRSSEILYTISWNYAHNFADSLFDFPRIVESRRVFDLFQHHDAITGTSKSFVIKDYIVQLRHAIIELFAVQRNSLKMLFENVSMDIINEDDINLYEDISRKNVYNIDKGNGSYVILFNSLLQPRDEFIRLLVNDRNAVVEDQLGFEVPIQITPVWKYQSILNQLYFIPNKYEISFIAHIPALSIVSYRLYKNLSKTYEKTNIFSNHFHFNNVDEFNLVSPILLENEKYITLENDEIVLIFHKRKGFLRRIYKKSTDATIRIIQDYIGYNADELQSGVYLFKPDDIRPETSRLLKKIIPKIMVIIGEIYSEMIVIYRNVITQKIRLYHTDTYLKYALVIESTTNMDDRIYNDLEIAMRFTTDIDNKNIFYTDSNRLQIQKRTNVRKIGIQGNYYPLTSMIYIEDEEHRLTLLTSHSTGGTSNSSGSLEVMLDRKIPRDDGRGLNEGVVDNKKCTHRFILVFETIKKPPILSIPTYLVNHLSNSLNYPVNVYVNAFTSYVPLIPRSIELIDSPINCNVHLVNLRTQPHREREKLPSNNALLILQNQIFGCETATSFECRNSDYSKSIRFNYARVEYLKETSLTGIESEDGELLGKLEESFAKNVGLKTYNVTFE